MLSGNEVGHYFTQSLNIVIQGAASPSTSVPGTEVSNNLQNDQKISNTSITTTGVFSCNYKELNFFK